MANQNYTYTLQNERTQKGLISAVEEFLTNDENMETQLVTDNDGYQILQARAKGGKAKQFVGMDKAITVRFVKKSGDKVCMEIGESKWVDKGTVMAVSMFVLWPLAVTSGIGMYKQAKLPGKIKNAADEYMGVSLNVSVPQKKEWISESTATRLAYAAQKIMKL